MADWRQIQARIRKAKASDDAPAQLAELYERTRDAMVAFELAQWQEKAGANAEAARWYTAAAEKFRRAQWRTKAEESLTRLGAPVPAPSTDSNPTERAGEAPGLETPTSSAGEDEPETSSKSGSRSKGLPLAKEPQGGSETEEPATEPDAALSKPSDSAVDR